MVTMMSTKLTKGGQTTIPKEVRTALGIMDGARVYWTFDGHRAWVTATPADPLEVISREDFLARLAEAEVDVASGRIKDASKVSAELRARYGLV